MPFDVSTVTLKGAELLSSATAQNKLVISGCDADDTILTASQAAQISSRPVSPISTTTDVTQIGSTSNHVQSRVYFRAGTNNGGDVNTLYLFGYSQNDPSNVYVIFVASSSDQIHLPLPTDIVTEYQAALDIVYTIANQSVSFATQATYCSLSEFNLLKERTVTTHKEGDPSQGDDQDIYGIKAFKDPISLEDVYINNSVQVGGDADFDANVKIGSDSANPVTVTLYGDLNVVSGSRVVSHGAITIESDGALVIDGEIIANNEYSHQYVPILTLNPLEPIGNTANLSNIKEITAGSGTFGTITCSSASPSITLVSTSANTPSCYIELGQIWLTDSSSNTTISINSSGNVSFGGKLTVEGDIKADSSGAKAEFYNCDVEHDLSSANITCIEIDVDIIKISGPGSIVTVTNPGGMVTVSGTVAPSVSGSSDLGTSSLKWGSVYANQLNGVLPKPTVPSGTTLTDSELPVGTIFMARVVTNSVSHTIGEIITIDSLSTYTSATVADDSGGSSSYSLPVGWKLVLLQCTGSSNSTFTSLVMRTE